MSEAYTFPSKEVSDALRDVAVIQALRDEVARLRGAITAINAAWNTLSHDQSVGGFHAWYSAHIELVEAALTSQGGKGGVNG